MIELVLKFFGIALIAFLIYKMLIYPVVQLIKIKIQFGDANYLKYFPFLGPMKHYIDGQKLSGDCYHFHKIAVKENTNVKFITSQFGIQPYIGLFDSEMMKEFLQNQ